MRRRSLATPKWETHVSQTIHKVKKESKSRSLKSSDLYECVCIFISDHLKKQIFSYATVSLYYQHLKSFGCGYFRTTCKLLSYKQITRS